MSDLSVTAILPVSSHTGGSAVRRTVGLTLALLIGLAMAPGAAEAARTKVISGGGLGCNFGIFSVDVSWERAGGRVASVAYTRWLADGASWVDQGTTSVAPDSATHANVRWSSMPEGYYSYSLALIGPNGAVLATYDYRPSTQYCYAWP
jgi:hypothetical protein